MSSLSSPPADISYCGSPAVPEELWTRWNFDPPLILALLLLAGAYFVRALRDPKSARPRGAEQAAFYTGWTITVICFVSPLCALSVSLFTARVTQHMLLVLVAAPLFAYGRAGYALLSLKAGQCRLCGRSAPGTAVFLTAAAFAVFLWAWHTPQPYDSTFRSDLLYWAMHLSLLLAAILFWAAQMGAVNAGGGIAVAAAGIATTIQMSLLGAVLTFASSPLFTSHLDTTFLWGLTPLEDQQLGGLIMWVPGGLIFLASNLLLLAAALADEGKEVPARS